MRLIFWMATALFMQLYMITVSKSFNIQSIWVLACINIVCFIGGAQMSAKDTALFAEDSECMTSPQFDFSRVLIDKMQDLMDEFYEEENEAGIE